jgi:hypothetical protein
VNRTPRSQTTPEFDPHDRASYSCALYLGPSETGSRIMSEEAGEDRYEAVVAYLKIYIKKTITTCLPEFQAPGHRSIQIDTSRHSMCVHISIRYSSPVKHLRCEIVKGVTRCFKILSQSSRNVKHDLVPLLSRMIKMPVALPSLPHTSSRRGMQITRRLKCINKIVCAGR